MRSDDSILAARLRSSYAGLLVDDPRTDDFSLAMRPPSAVGTGRAVLLHDRCELVRSQSPDRLLRALDARLGALVGDPPKGSVRVIDMGALVYHGRAVMVPRSLLSRSGAVERACRDRGIAISDPEATRLDPSDGTVEVTQGLVGAAALEVADPVIARPGRYRLDAIHWRTFELDTGENRAATLARLLGRTVDHGSTPPQHVMAAMIGVAGLTSTLAVAEGGSSDVVAICEALSG